MSVWVCASTSWEERRARQKAINNQCVRTCCWEPFRWEREHYLWVREREDGSWPYAPLLWNHVPPRSMASQISPANHTSMQTDIPHWRHSITRWFDFNWPDANRTLIKIGWFDLRISPQELNGAQPVILFVFPILNGKNHTRTLEFTCELVKRKHL